MDLVGIFHMVDMPSSGKRDFNHIYVVGLILSILIHLESVLFDSVNIGFPFFLGCSFNVHVLVWLLLAVPKISCFDMVLAFCSQNVGCSKNIGLCHPFLTVCFLSVFSVTRCCSVFNGIVWFPVLLLAFIDDPDVDHPVVVYAENVYIEVHIYTNILIYRYFYFLFQPFNIHL